VTNDERLSKTKVESEFNVNETENPSDFGFTQVSAVTDERVQPCITANVLQTKVDADKLATELS